MKTTLHQYTNIVFFPLNRHTSVNVNFIGKWVMDMQIMHHEDDQKIGPVLDQHGK
jgi:hypothetical protein